MSDDSKQQLGMEQKRTLTSMGRQSDTVSHWTSLCRSSLPNVDPMHTLLVLDISQQQQRWNWKQNVPYLGWPTDAELPPCHKVV